MCEPINERNKAKPYRLSSDFYRKVAKLKNSHNKTPSTSTTSISSANNQDDDFIAETPSAEVPDAEEPSSEMPKTPPSICDVNEMPHTGAEYCNADTLGSSDSDSEIDFINVRNQIQQWALKYQIHHNSLNELLRILRENASTNLKNVLPTDSRSLLKTPRSSNIVKMANGEYWYNGLENYLKYVLSKNISVLLTCIFLTFNIDGLPIARSTKNEFWPILCRIKGINIAPIVVAIFFGSTKPPLELFLRPFVSELLKLLQDGLVIQNRIFTVKIRCFICDTPARCSIKGTVGFNSYHGCMKCAVIGEYDRRGRHMSFPRTDMPLPTDHSFRNRLDPDHHKEKSAIEDLPIDLVNDFIIADALHLLDLGVMKRCLLGWTSGSYNVQTKWPAREIQEVSRKLIEIKSTTPSEIHQGRLRELDSIHFWKGTEFKNFLLYFGPVVLKQHLSLEVYQHFLTLFCATTICYSDAYIPYRHISEKLYVDYIERFAEIYGQDSVSSNIHNLCHVVNDVKRFGSLPSLSAYPFENMLFRIKNLLRKGNQPLAQVANRIQELTKLNVDYKCQQSYPVVKYESLLETGEKAFATVKISENCSLSKNIKDKWFSTTTNDIIEMKFATCNEGKIKIHGSNIKTKCNFFDLPFKSSYINIYATSLPYETDILKEYDLQDVKCKLISMVCSNQMVFFPILTTLEVKNV